MTSSTPGDEPRRLSDLDAPALITALEGMTSVSQGKRLLGALSKAQLRDLADRIGLRGMSSLTKPKLIDEIVYLKIQGPMTLYRAADIPFRAPGKD